MPSISFKIVDATGNKSTIVEVPDNALASQVLQILMRKMDLPSTTPDGKKAVYCFVNTGSGVTLDQGQSLAAAGVKSGDVLRIEAQAPGAAPPVAAPPAAAGAPPPVAGAPPPAAGAPPPATAPGQAEEPEADGKKGKKRRGKKASVTRRKKTTGQKVRPFVVVLLAFVVLVLLGLAGYKAGLRYYQQHETQANLTNSLNMMTKALAERELEKIERELPRTRAIIKSSSSLAPTLEAQLQDWMQGSFKELQNQINVAIDNQSWDETTDILTSVRTFHGLMPANKDREAVVRDLEERCRGIGKLTFAGTIQDAAEVYRNGRLLGKTDEPLTNLIVGIHNLELRLEGYRPASYSVTIPPTGGATLDLKPMQLIVGALLVEAATVDANGEMKIVTDAEVKMADMPWTAATLPWLREDIKPQDYLVQLRVPNFESAVMRGEVRDGYTNSLSFILKPMPGRIRVLSQRHALGVWDTATEQQWGVANEVITNIAPGTYILELRLDKHHPARVKVEMPANGDVVFNAPNMEVRRGNLRIMARVDGPPLEATNATIRLNGQPQGSFSLPHLFHDLPEQSYTVELDVSNCHPVARREVEIFDQKETRELFVIIPLEAQIVVKCNVPTVIFEGMRNLGRNGEKILLTANEKHDLTLRPEGYAPVRRRLRLKPLEERVIEMPDYIVPRKREVQIDLGGGQRLVFIWIEPLGLWAGTFEITNGQYRRFKPDHAMPPFKGAELNGDTQPAANISWANATEFSNWLTEKHGERFPVGFVFRLPTVDEWEALASCGKQRLFPWGNDWPPTSGNYGYIAGYTDAYEASCPVDKSGRNEWGLYGLGGNVWEWCQDKWSPTSKTRMLRGASWDVTFGQESLRIGFRKGLAETYADRYIGMRILIAQALPVEEG